MTNRKNRKWKNRKKIHKQDQVSFSPYKDFTLGVYWDNNKNALVPQNLTALYQQSGANNVTLAFVTTQTGAPCTPAWGGYSEYSVTNQWGSDDIAEFQKNGGQVTISFGGAVGDYLEKTCQDVPSLVNALQTVIKAYGVTNFDFDIEGANLANQAAITRLAQALKILQGSNNQLIASVTLPVMQTGLTAAGLNVINTFVQQGVELEQVNIMAMDYGMGDPAAMGQNAIQAANSTFTQLQPIFSGKSSQALWGMVGITPMIGLNDIQPERFTLADATMVSKFAQETGCNLHMWSMDADHPCMKTQSSPQCSGAYNGQQMQNTDYQFAETFLGNGLKQVSTLGLLAAASLVNHNELSATSAEEARSNLWLVATAGVAAGVVALGSLYLLKKCSDTIGNSLQKYIPGFWKTENVKNTNVQTSQEEVQPSGTFHV